MAVYENISLIEILNTQEELKAFPLEGGEIQLLLSGPFDEKNIKDYVFIVQSHDIETFPNISGNKVKHIGDINLDLFDILDYTYTTQVSGPELGSRPIFIIKPSVPLLPNQNYHLVISETLAPEFYSLEKTNSLGPSRINLEIDPDTDLSSLPASTVVQYEIEITAGSTYSNNQHLVEYTVRQDGTPVISNDTININVDKIEIEEGINAVFDTNFPFATGEIFLIELTNFSRSGGTTLVQKIETSFDTEIFPEPEDRALKRINQESLVEFYEKNGYARKLGLKEGFGETIADNEIKYEANVECIYPNKIRIDIGQEFDETSLDEDFFNFAIGPAFDNYMLPNMGLYNDNDQYVIYYKVSPNIYGERTVIDLLVTKDTDNQVMANDKFIVLPGPV